MASWREERRTTAADRRRPRLGGRRATDIGQRLRRWLDTAPRTNGELTLSRDTQQRP